MIMVRAIVRPEKADEILAALAQAGFSGATRMDVYGRGKQKGIKIGNVFYDELPKELLMLVVDEADEKTVCDTIMATARTSEEGNYGDGRIFVSPVKTSYTISSKSEDR